MTPDRAPAASGAGAAVALRALPRAGRVWIGCHVDPDGDAIGSLLGLGRLLETRGLQVDLACQDAAPEELGFLPGLERIGEEGPDPARHALAIAVDAGDAGRLGSLYDPARWRAMDTLVIDHHVSNPGFGRHDWIEPTASSTAEMVAELAALSGTALDVDAATCLLTGIVTDTLGFRTSSTTPRTMDAARDLMEAGADLAEISLAVFGSRPLGALRLIGRALERLTRDGPFALSTLRLTDFRELGVDAAQARGISSFLATAAEPAAVALLREREDGDVDVSMRARPGVDLVPAARALGGGGHAPAAGARLDGPLDAALRRVRDALHEQVVLPAPWR